MVLSDGRAGGTALAWHSRDAARELCISPRMLWTLTACGAIPVVRIGRAVRYRPDELKAWLDAGAPTEPNSAERVRASMKAVTP